MPEDLTTAQVEAVTRALENTNFRWRTVPGVAKETDLSEETVRNLLASLGDSVIRSAVPSAKGNDLFTTRRHYRATASVGEKLLGVLKNRAS